MSENGGSASELGTGFSYKIKEKDNRNRLSLEKLFNKSTTISVVHTEH